MRKILVVIVLLFLVFAAFLMFAPEDRLNMATEYKRRITKNPGQLCFDYTKKKLKDPDSARYVSYENGENNKIIIHYKAKNGYGAYVNGTDMCVLGSDGNVDEAMTKGEEVISNLERKIDEINQKNASKTK